MIAMDLILALEGKYSNNPNDPGGETMYGILSTEYQKYLKEKGLPPRSVKKITNEEVLDIYENKYYKPMKLSLLDEEKAVFMFQFGVNCGIKTAIRLVQEVLEVTADGIMGPVTAKAINESDIEVLAEVQLNRYEELIENNEKLEDFRTGWKNRVRDTLTYISEM